MNMMQQAARPHEGRRPTLAIVGAGITGLALARELQHEFDITLFESEARLGGNIRPVQFTDLQGRSRELDTGFLAYQPAHYPHFSTLLDALGVANIEMPLSSSLEVRDWAGNLLYNPGDFFRHNIDPGNSHQAQDRRRLFGLFIALEQDPTLLDDVHLNIEQFLAERKFGRQVLDKFVVPIMAMIWGLQEHQVRAMSAGCALGELCRLLSPARRLTPSTRPYLHALIGSLSNVNLLPETAITRLYPSDAGVTVYDKQQTRHFDYAVMTTFPALTLSLVNNLPQAITQCLSTMPYYRSIAVVHSANASPPPDRQNATLFTLRYLHETSGEWITTWDLNSDQDRCDPNRPVVSFAEDMNVLESLLTGSHFYKTFVNHHPALTPAFWQAQMALKKLNVGPRIFLAGSYLGRLGNHENAYCSALDVAKQLQAVRISI